jgi:hypothetical protein
MEEPVLSRKDVRYRETKHSLILNSPVTETVDGPREGAVRVWATDREMEEKADFEGVGTLLDEN